MTRQFHKALRSTSTRKAPLRTPNPHTLGFTCFRLVPLYDGEPGDPAYASIELEGTSNAMGAFLKRPARPRRRAA